MASVVRHAVVNGRPPEILTSRPVAAAARAHAGVRLVGRVVLPVQIAACFENFPFSSFLPSFPSFPPLKKWKSITEIKLKVTGYLGPRRLVRPRLQKEHLPIWNLAQSSGHYRPACSTCVNMRRWLARVSTCSPAGTTYHRPR